MNNLVQANLEANQKLSNPEHLAKVASDNQIIRGMTQKRIKYFGLTVLVTLLSVGIFGGLGYILDMSFGTKPAFILLGVGFSYIATQITLVNLINYLTSKKDDRN